MPAMPSSASSSAGPTGNSLFWTTRFQSSHDPARECMRSAGWKPAVRKSMNSTRRRFLRYLAASPLLAGSDLLAQEKRLPEPPVWAPRTLDKLIEHPGEALSVFDFEPVMHKN